MKKTNNQRTPGWEKYIVRPAGRLKERFLAFERRIFARTSTRIIVSACLLGIAGVAAYIFFYSDIKLFSDGTSKGVMREAICFWAAFIVPGISAVFILTKFLREGKIRYYIRTFYGFIGVVFTFFLWVITIFVFFFGGTVNGLP